MERQFRINWTLLVEEAKQRRIELKLTQQQLALLADVSTPTISRFENGKKDIQLSSIFHILKVLGMTDQRTLHFPNPDPIYLPDRMVVRFWGQDGDKKIQFEISSEALDDHFNGQSKDKLKIFKAHQARIEHEARRKYLANSTTSNESILIKTSDL